MSIKPDIVDKTTEIQDRNSRKLKVIDELRTYEYNIIVSIEFLINIRKGCDNMVATETITIKVPAGMKKYMADTNVEMELTRNALLLYPYIANRTISHGRAAEILGIRKSELIDIYDKLGYSYFDMTMDDLDTELKTFRQLKKESMV